MDKLKSVMYMFEHKLIPMFFFRDRERFCAIAHKNPEFLFKILEMVCEDMGAVNPYSEEDIHAEVFAVDEKIRMLKIDFPKPEAPPLCYSEYLFFDADFKDFQLFTAEKSMFSDEEAIICGWTENGGHMNFGLCRGTEKDWLRKCLELYMRK